MDYRRPLRRRLWLYSLVAALPAIAAVFLLIGAAEQRLALARQQRVGELTLELFALANRIQDECQAALTENGQADAIVFASQIGELTRETEEAVFALAETLQTVGLERQQEGLLDEMSDLTDASGRLRQQQMPVATAIADCEYTAATIEGLLPRILGEGSAAITDQSRRAGTLMRVAAACVFLGFAGAVIGVLMTVFDMLGDILGSVDLEKELKAVERNAVFQRRMLNVVPAPSEAGDWKLTVARVIGEHRTHVTFEAEASHNTHRVLLWGKAYLWPGRIKGLQRVLWPSYSKVTWRALCKMYNAGLGAPFPIVLSPIRRRGITAGSIVLAEHVGSVQQAKSIARGRFTSMTPGARKEFLRDLIAFWTKLHAVGIYRLQVRYIHCGEEAPGGTAPLPFYLFDLDKVLVSPWLGRLCGRLMAERDNRRLRQWLANYLTAEEAQLCDHLLRAAFCKPAVASQSRDARTEAESSATGTTT